MTIESHHDLSELRALGLVAAGIRDRVAAAAVGGVTTRNLDELARKLAGRAGARSAPQDEYDFPGFVCLSVNDAVVHGIPDAHVLQAGDLLTVDVTITRGGYVVDTATTVEVGAGSNRLAACAASALDRGLGALAQSRGLPATGMAIETEVQGWGYHILRQLCGHGVGRRIHEWPAVPNFGDPATAFPLWDGLVLAVEPIIAERRADVVEDDDGWTLRTSNGCRAAHCEHTVVITPNGVTILTGPEIESGR